MLFRSPADQIDRVLVNDSGEVASRVAALKAKHIAVLPFQVQIGQQPATFKQGVEGLQMANKLQNLLVLTNPAGGAGEYVVLADAAKKAAEAGKKAGKAIDWTTPAGRKALLDLQLPVAWDDKAAHAPDTYLTGTLKVSADLKSAVVVLQTFSRANPELKGLCTLKESATAGIRVDRNTLADLGKSFAVSKSVLTRVHKGGLAGRTKSVVEPDEAASDAAAGGGGPAVAPSGGAIVVPNCPVELTVRYNGQPVSASADGSNNLRMAQTPPAGARIDFQLVNTSDKAVAVVLTIDGKNLIQLNPDERVERNNNRETWRKFVLEPRGTVALYKVEGWLKDATGKTEAIKVDTEEKSAERFASMSPQTAGKIELLVFPANEGVIPPLTTDGSAAIGGGTSPVGGTTPADADPAVQQEQATDAGAMEQLDKNMGKTRSAAAAKNLVLKKLPKNFTLAPTKKGGLQITAPAPKLKGVTKGLAADGGGDEFKGDEVVEKGFVHTALPTAAMVVTYYTPDMAGPAAPPAGNNN